jgi:sugar lactone lactonase YvrE
MLSPLDPAGLDAAPLDARRDLLGEGPTWDADAQRMIHVDIANGLVHAWRPQDDTTRTLTLDGEVGAALPRERGGLIIARENELLLCDEDGDWRTRAVVEQDRPDNRFNDCRVDPQGRLWAGTMSRSRVPGTASLYRLSGEEPIVAVIAGTTLSNGIGWSPGGDRMYFIDSVEQRIDLLDFDGAAGTIANRRPFTAIEPADGMPDGLTVDAEGGVWVCLFRGGALRRYDSDGTLDAHIPLAASCPTCPAFGGEDLTTLYVTTTRHRLTPEQAEREPLAGAVLVLKPGVAGMPAHRFQG